MGLRYRGFDSVGVHLRQNLMAHGLLVNTGTAIHEHTFTILPAYEVAVMRLEIVFCILALGCDLLEKEEGVPSE